MLLKGMRIASTRRMRLPLSICSIIALPFVMTVVAACVGDDPVGEGVRPKQEENPSSGAPSDANADGRSHTDSGEWPGGGDSGSGKDAEIHDAAGDSPSEHDSGNPGEKDADIEDASVLDAAVEAGLPSIACLGESLGAGAFNFRCSAGPGTLTPGGTILVGSYLLSGVWYSAGCAGSTYNIGSATLFQQDDRYFLRFIRIRKATTDSAGVTTTGTVWLEPGVGGALQQTEVCDIGTKGTLQIGQYEVRPTTSGSSLVLRFADHQETWSKN